MPASLLLLGVFTPVALADDPGADAIEYLHRALTTHRDGSHLGMLLALRQLQDPALRPWLLKLVQDDAWPVQVHAVLGLAEISDDGQVDPWLITRVRPEARARLVAEAIDADRLDSATIKDLLTWEGIEPLPHLLLLAEQHLAGEPIDQAALTRLAGEADPRIAGIASCILAQRGDVVPFNAFHNRLVGVPRETRAQHVISLFDAIRQYRLDAMLDWVHGQIESKQAADEVIYWGVYTILQFDQAAGLRLWRQHLGPAPDPAQRVHYGLLLLRTEPPVPASAYEPLRGDEALIQAMIRAGRAMAGGGADVVPALIDLLQQQHLPTTDWAMDAVRSLPHEQAARVYDHLLRQVQQDAPPTEEQTALAIAATRQLERLEPERTLQRLLDAPDDSPLQEVILRGLSDASASAVGDAARLVRRIGAGRPDSLVRILIARHSEQLDPEDLQMLGLVAGGGGRVSSGERAQAAWLYLKHTDRLDEALTRVFASD